MTSADDQTPVPGTPAEATARSTPSRRAIIGRALLIVGVLVVVFGLLLPRLIDFGAVRDALAALTAGQLALLGVASVVAWVANAGPSKILIAGLSWPRAVGSDMAARAVVSTIPGPTDIATRFLLYRQWSIPTAVASAGIVFAAMFETFSTLVLPVFATGSVLISGETVRGRALVFAAVSLAVLVVGTALLLGIVRSEGLARRIGGWLDRVARRLWAVVRREPPSGIVDSILDLRVRAKVMLTTGGLLGFVAAVVAKLAGWVVLVVALWCVGVGPDVLAPSAVLAAMAFVGVVTLIPTTPGNVGTTEVAYIGILTSVTGPGYTEQLTAAILLYRIAQWLVPIPIGWVALILIRRGHPGGLLGVGEAAPVDAPAAAG